MRPWRIGVVERLRLGDFLNLTNERNWYHNGDAFTANQLVFQEQPFRVEGYFKIRF